MGRSWEEPAETLDQNLRMTLNLLEAVRAHAPEAPVVVASSGEVYGPPERLPVTEEAPLRPQNPYAVSKAAAELLAGQYADAFGLRVVRTRAFNHAGPGQQEDYVLGSLDPQVAEAEAAGADEVVLLTGNPDSARDFTDVRDVVPPTWRRPAWSRGPYNVCSGRSVSVRELVKLVSRGPPAWACVTRSTPPACARMTCPRCGAPPSGCGPPAAGSPRFPLDRTVADGLQAWREEMARR